MSFLSEQVKNLVFSFFKYLLAGGTGFLMDFATLSFCYYIMEWHYLLSATLGFVAGLVFVYVSSNMWVFDTRQMKNHRAAEFLIFLLIGLIGLLLTNALMWALVDQCGWHPLFSKLLTTGIVLMWNFSSRKVILY